MVRCLRGPLRGSAAPLHTSQPFVQGCKMVATAPSVMPSEQSPSKHVGEEKALGDPPLSLSLEEDLSQRDPEAHPWVSWTKTVSSDPSVREAGKAHL